MRGRVVRVNIPLDVTEVGLHNRHVVFQLQVLVHISLQATLGRFVMHEPVITVGRVLGLQPVNLRLLHKVIDEKNQKGHAVRVELAEADPLGKLCAKPVPIRVFVDCLQT